MQYLHGVFKFITVQLLQLKLVCMLCNWCNKTAIERTMSKQTGCKAFFYWQIIQ
jgi:hypothetical protein